MASTHARRDNAAADTIANWNDNEKREPDDDDDDDDDDDEDSAVIVWDDPSSQLVDLRHLLLPKNSAVITATAMGDGGEAEKISSQIPLAMSQEMERLDFRHVNKSMHDHSNGDEAKERNIHDRHRFMHPGDTPDTNSNMKQRCAKQAVNYSTNTKTEAEQLNHQLVESRAPRGMRTLDQSTTRNDHNHSYRPSKRSHTTHVNKAIAYNALCSYRPVLSQTQTMININSEILCCASSYSVSPIGRRNLFSCTIEKFKGNEKAHCLPNTPKYQKQQQQSQVQISKVKSKPFGGGASVKCSDGGAVVREINTDMETPTVCYENNNNDDKSSDYEWSEGRLSGGVKVSRDKDGSIFNENKNVVHISSGVSSDVGGAVGVRMVGSCFSMSKHQSRMNARAGGSRDEESLQNPSLNQLQLMHQKPEPRVQESGHQPAFADKEVCMKSDHKQNYDEFDNDEDDWDLEAIDRSVDAAITQSSRYDNKNVKSTADKTPCPSAANATTGSEFSDGDGDFFEEIDFKALDRLICLHQHQ